MIWLGASVDLLSVEREKGVKRILCRQVQSFWESGNTEKTTPFAIMKIPPAFMPVDLASHAYWDSQPTMEQEFAESIWLLAASLHPASN